MLNIKWSHARYLILLFQMFLKYQMTARVTRYLI